MTLDMPQARALDFLQNLASDDPGQPTNTRIDTHANVIFLIGSKAFKVKRAVTFPFLDYSTLALREDACRREVIYNGRYAQDLYLRASAITECTDGTLELDGAGPPIEWVVVMKRFPTEQELDIIAEAGSFSDDLSDDLATMMVTAHDKAPRREAHGFVAELRSYILQNAVAFSEHPELFPPSDAKRLTSAAHVWLDRIMDLVELRGRHGLIRLCHGDAHLRNIVLIEGKPVLFDAIEFSDAIATCDVLYDLAFLLMDLWERGQRCSANRVFNRYLDNARRSHDTEGLAALPFYLMMRAAIRAKIAASAAANQQDPLQRETQQKQATSYFLHAVKFLEASDPVLTAIGGFSGTGKTSLAFGLAPDIGKAPGARVLRTDVERKAGLGLGETERAPAEAYTREASDAVYAALDTQIQHTLAAGHSAIFDAVFAKQEERAQVEAIAERVEVQFRGLWLEAPEAVLRDRVAARKADASDATPNVVARQLLYETGEITWRRVDASGSFDETLESAWKAIRGVNAN